MVMDRLTRCRARISWVISFFLMSIVLLHTIYGQTIQNLWNMFQKWKLVSQVIAHCSHLIAYCSHASFPRPWLHLSCPYKIPTSFSFKSRSCTFGVGKLNVLAFFKAQSVESSSVKWSRSKWDIQGRKAKKVKIK